VSLRLAARIERWLQSASPDMEHTTMESVDFVLYPQQGLWPAALTFLLCIGYICLLLLARCIWIYQRNHMHLRAYADMVEARLQAEQDKPEQHTRNEQLVTQAVASLLSRAREHIPADGSPPCLKSFLSSGGVGKQLAAWRLVHDADRIATDIWPDGHVEAYAVVAKEELKGIGSGAASALSEQLVKVMESGNKHGLKSLVKEARRLLFNSRDEYYESLADWQNKSVWLVCVTALVLFLVSAFLGGERFLILGAVGGLLARLGKSMKSRSAGFDYGVSWSILFLAPLVGALTGWAGVLLSDFVAGLEVLTFPGWDKSAKLLPLEVKSVLAVFFGFSATLFEGVMAGAEAALTKQPAGRADGSSK
jgi:hypothetical protein